MVHSFQAVLLAFSLGLCTLLVITCSASTMAKTAAKVAAKKSMKAMKASLAPSEIASQKAEIILFYSNLI